MSNLDIFENMVVCQKKLRRFRKNIAMEDGDRYYILVEGFYFLYFHYY